MPWGINQIDVVGFAVFRFITQRRSLGFDGDATLTLDIHRIENLGFHFTISKTAAELNNAISKR